ncbi:MAG: hypothetical protein ACYSUQ_15385, partial [Planctomycetota bacterium]
MFGRIRGVEEQIAEFLARHLGEVTEKPAVAAVDGDQYFHFGSLRDAALESGRRRLYSSAAEAESRGLTPAAGIRSMKTYDLPWPRHRYFRRSPYGLIP